MLLPCAFLGIGQLLAGFEIPDPPKQRTFLNQVSLAREAVAYQNLLCCDNLTIFILFGNA